METTARSKSRVFISALVVALLLFVCAATLRKSMGHDQLEQRLLETRAAVNDANVAAADSEMEKQIRVQLSSVLAKATADSLERPMVAAAVEPEWQKELMLYWVARRPDVDAIDIQVEARPPVRISLPPKEIEANRSEARTRVLYNNTLALPELERVLGSATPGARMMVTLVSQGKPVSDPAPITAGAK